VAAASAREHRDRAGGVCGMEIVSLAVVPCRRQAGLGRCLAQLVVEHARRAVCARSRPHSLGPPCHRIVAPTRTVPRGLQGCTSLWLYAAETAVRFWRELGFSPLDGHIEEATAAARCHHWEEAVGLRRDVGGGGGAPAPRLFNVRVPDWDGVGGPWAPGVGGQGCGEAVPPPSTVTAEASVPRRPAVLGALTP
jgi:hypothetical protein